LVIHIGCIISILRDVPCDQVVTEEGAISERNLPTRLVLIILENASKAHSKHQSQNKKFHFDKLLIKMMKNDDKFKLKEK
jgi:hypothetical protein